MASSSLISILLVAVMVSAAQAKTAWEWPRTRPYVVGHRGACGYRPDHTLASYQLAVDFGADFIECDVVLTKDLVPICRHEPLLSNTTDADAVFPNMTTSYVIDGYNYTGVFATDLTLAQVKQLKARQPIYSRGQQYDDIYDIPTLEEYIQLALSQNRTVGIYPETKHPTWHNALPHVRAARTTISDILLNMLDKYHYTGPLNSPRWNWRPAFIQSFELSNLVYLTKKTCIPLVFLTDDFSAEIPGENFGYTTYGDVINSTAALKWVATFAAGMGPWKNTLLVNNGTPGYVTPSGVINRIHRAGMQMHPYTFRAEASRLTYGSYATILDEFDDYFAKQGIDGAFTDFPNFLVQYMNIKKQEKARQWVTRLINAPARKKAGNPRIC